MNALFLALLVGVALYLVWQWDRDSRRRRAARAGQPRPASRSSAAAAPKVTLSTWLARLAVGAIAAWLVFLFITLFRSAT
ncbi:MAG: hypothetical protein IT535_05060 [Bauldia sp.]|nr:hypothetical protein [Bauldia sp.]